MCRLYMANKKFLTEKGEVETLKFLNQLEKSCGGHGNGILFIDNGKITLDVKAVDLKNTDIVNALFNNKNGLPDWFMYHTRVASKGSIKNENCHPYVNEDKSFALMMNGTDSSFGAFGKVMGDITDTEVIFKMIDVFGADLEALTELSPRFLGFKEGKVFATNPDGYQGLKFYEEDEAICIASESPTGETWSSMEEEYVWTEGEEIKVKTVKAYGGYTAYNYSTAYKNYLDKWADDIDSTKDENCTTCSLSKEEKDAKDLEEATEGWRSFKDVFNGIETIKETYPNMTYSTLQHYIDEIYSLYPMIEGMYCDIFVLETKEIMIQDENGEIHIA